MGGRCSCIKPSTAEATEKPAQQQSALLRKPRNMNLDLGDLIILQSLIRGYFDRRTTKTGLRLHMQTRMNRKNDQLAQKGQASRPEKQLTNGRPFIDVKLAVFDYGDPEGLSGFSPTEIEGQGYYRGEFNHKNQRHGKGMLRKFDGGIFEGWWAEDKHSGRGRMTYSDGAVYEGDWKNNRKHGSGQQVAPDGSKYVGAFLDGQRWGQGKLTGKGFEYEGSFEKGLFNGPGRGTWADGRRYEGHWKAGSMHGTGIYMFEDGRVYEGQFVDNMKDGFGVVIWPDSRRYEGGWSRDKQHGAGVFYSALGVRRRGEWANGKRTRWLGEE